MPYDTIPNTTEVPIDLNFEVEFEPTKVHDKKYVINNITGEYLGIVGRGFRCANHKDFFEGTQNVMNENLSQEAMSDPKVTWKTARNNAWAMMDITLPNVTTTILTDKHETKIGQRLIALHGIDGSCSNQVFFGAIDFFCTNGMIRGDYDTVRRKNTSNFCMDRFIQELNKSSADFYEQAEQLQRWARTPIEQTLNMKQLLEAIIKSDRKAEKMFPLVQQELSKRGKNVFSLYSAFTNYASYADERNGFNLRNTGKDTASQSMWAREQEVSKWVSSPQFKQLVAA